jgi:NAD(P)-dependent dehydrogenase (short-subunit alcohol dehydrogenase family)
MKDRVVIVTGGSRGIGLATAERFVRAGARVVIAARSEGSGAEAVESLRRAGGRADFVRADVADESQVEALVKRCLELHGRLDCAFNNAGAEPDHRRPLVHEYPSDNWRSILDVHLSGLFLCMKHEIPTILEAGGGAIVNMASVYGFGASPEAPPSYVASKHGAIGLTRAAAIQYAPRNLRVNVVCPGYVRTPMYERAVREAPAIDEGARAMHPMGRIGEPHEVAEAVLWLCSDAASFVTGHALMVDGGMSARL